jgi:hypothetical protein
MPPAIRRAALAAMLAALAAVAVHPAVAQPTDQTAPVITRQVSGPVGEGGWFRGPVNVRWTVSDPESPWTTSGCDAQTLTAETSGVTLECRATSAGGTTSDGMIVRIDSTGPSVTGAAPDRRPDRRGWYRAPVSVAFAGADALSGLALCGVAPYAGPDARRARVTGGCRDVAGNDSAPLAFTFRYDATGPRIIRAVASRRPDHRRWYTRPVRFRFRARDALSGRARCRRVRFRGPDGRGAVRGSCRDRAGNRSVRAFPIRYDATAPKVALRIRPGHRMAIMRWRASRDARRFVLSRSIRGAPWTRAVVYRGRRRRHVDVRLVNGQRYRYKLVAIDRARNRTVRRGRVKPRRALLRPRANARVAAPPLLRWTPIRRARYYNVQLVRHGHTVLKAWPSRARYRIPASWSVDGRPEALVPGAYRWYVWPGFGRRSRHRYGRLIGGRRFVVVPKAA